MRLKHVYLLRDGNGNVVDVGESYNPESRLYAKTKMASQSNRKTNFYGRTDITQEIVSSWPTEKEARAEEERLKRYYGLIVTERNGGLPRKLTMEQVKEIRSKYTPYK